MKGTPLLLVILASVTLALVVGASPDNDYDFTVTHGEATIRGYTGPGGDVVIPSTLGGYPVVAISRYRAGGPVFGPNETLTSIVIPDSVTSIGAWAFEGSTSLTSIEIPDSVTFIETGAFTGCTSLATINVDPDNSDFSSISGVLFNAEQTVLHTYPAGKTDSAYEIPDSVTSIGIWAFSGCKSLTNVEIPDSVTSIGHQAFQGCTNLERTIFRGSAPSISSLVFANTAPDFAVFYFDGADGFTSPTWEGYPAMNLGQSRPFTEWLVDSEVLSAHYTGPATDLNNDGVSLLMAFALDQDPRNNLRGHMPQAVHSNGNLSMHFFGDQPGINYTVEASTDLVDWDSAGVTLSEPDAEGNQTAMVDTEDHDTLFLRLVVAESSP